MKKIKNRERNILKRFFVNEKENERIKLMMRKTGITNFSIFARRACCNKEIFTLDFSEYKNIISEISSTKSELKRIGNNINQIAKHLNENKNNLTQDVISDYQSQLENLEEKIQKVVKYISEGEKK
ncbi:plasmid mobilization relaxosome protein MobC [Lactococcus lactis]